MKIGLLLFEIGRQGYYVLLVAWLKSSNTVLPFTIICPGVLKLQWVLPTTLSSILTASSAPDSPRVVTAGAGRAVWESYPEQQYKRNKDLISSAGRKHNHEITIILLCVLFVRIYKDIYCLWWVTCFLPPGDQITQLQLTQNKETPWYQVNDLDVALVNAVSVWCKKKKKDLDCRVNSFHLPKNI